MAWIAGVDYEDFDQDKESDDEDTNGNDHEKVIYNYKDVAYESNNEEEGKWDAKDDNQVIETDEVNPNDIEVDHRSNGQDLRENDPIQDQSISATSNDHDDNSEEEQPQPMDNL